MNAFDVVASGLIATGLALGIFMGIIRAVLGAVALTVGGVVAVASAPRFAELLSSVIASPRLATLVGFVCAYALTLASFAGVAWLLRRSLGALGLRWLDRTLGAFVGVALTVGLSGTIAFTMTERVPSAAIVRTSVLMAPLSKLAGWLLHRLPGDFERRFAAVIGSSRGGSER